jgi:hypothetical protein
VPLFVRRRQNNLKPQVFKKIGACADRGAVQPVERFIEDRQRKPNLFCALVLVGRC